MAWLEANLQMLFFFVALGGLPFAAGTLLLRFGGKFFGVRIRWSQALVLAGVMAQGFLVPFFAGTIGAVFLAALLVQWFGMKFWRGAFPLTASVWIVNALLLLATRLVFFHHL